MHHVTHLGGEKTRKSHRPLRQMGITRAQSLLAWVPGQLGHVQGLCFKIPPHTMLDATPELLD